MQYEKMHFSRQKTGNKRQKTCINITNIEKNNAQHEKRERSTKVMMVLNFLCFPPENQNRTEKMFVTINQTSKFLFVFHVRKDCRIIFYYHFFFK